MSTSALYHTFSLSDIQHIATYEEADRIIFCARPQKKALRCSKCKSHKIVCKGRKQRLFWLPPIGSKKCFLKIEVPRLRCHRCQRVE